MRFIVALALLLLSPVLGLTHEGEVHGTPEPVVTETEYVLKHADGTTETVTLSKPVVTPDPDPTPDPPPVTNPDDPNVHPDDASKHDEHLAALALVPVTEATHVLTTGVMPSLPNDAKVYVPEGVTVTVDRAHAERIKWLRLNGTLRFARDVQTDFNCDTCIIDVTGWLDLGTLADPRTKPLTWLFVDNGPVSDPMQLSRGIVCHGRFDFGGSVVTFKSENTERLCRGHIMVMHKPAFNGDGIRIVDCGRTDKSRPVTDFPNIDNLRARYPLHFHRCGLTTPMRIGHVTVEGSPGWGIVNHESNVECDDSVCIRTYGAGFVAETGRERGYFKNWRASDIPGDKTQYYIASRISDANDDWGVAGHAVWIHGGNVKIGPGVAERCAHPRSVVAIAYGGVDIPFAEIDPEFPLLRGATAFPPYPPGVLPTGDVPVRVSGVVADSIDLRSLQNEPRQFLYRGRMQDCEFKTVISGYSNFTDYLRVRSIGNRAAPLPSMAWSHTGVVFGHNYQDCEVAGYQVGVLMPSDGTNTVTGGRYSNVVDFLILNKPKSARPEGTVHIFDGVEFPSLAVDPAKFTPVQMNSPTWPPLKFPQGRFNFYLAPWMVWFDIRTLKATDPNWQRLFHWEETFGTNHVIKVRAKGSDTWEYLNFPEWGRDYPLPACVPASIREKYPTNGQLYDATGCCLWGIVPVSGETRPGSNGIWTKEPAVFLKAPKTPTDN